MQVRDPPCLVGPQSTTLRVDGHLVTSQVRKCALFSPDFATSHRHGCPQGGARAGEWGWGICPVLGSNSPTVATQTVRSDIIHNECRVCVQFADYVRRAWRRIDVAVAASWSELAFMGR